MRRVIHSPHDVIPKESKLAFEATGMAYPAFRTFGGLGYSDITVAHPAELAWIIKSRKKNDKVDSLKIAKLHLVSMLPESHLLSEEEQISRDLVIQRVKLDDEIRKLKSALLSYLKRESVYESISPEDSPNRFSLYRRDAMKEITFNDNRDLVLKTMMDRLEFLEKQCIPLQDEIKKNAKESEDIKLLMTIRGVDYYLASLLSSYIRDIRRFPSDDQLASMFGIVPVMKESSDVRKRGRISKEGPARARWALSIMVDTVIRYNPPIKMYYLSAKNRTGSGKKAHVLTMRKLVRMMFHMLTFHEAWRYEDQQLTKKKLARLNWDVDHRLRE